MANQAVCSQNRGQQEEVFACQCVNNKTLQ